MSISKINEDYNLQLSIRDSLSTLKAELSILEDNELIQRYLELKKYYEQNKDLEQKDDNTILDEVTKNDTSLEVESYFCYGNNFTGVLTKTGRYHINVLNYSSFVSPYYVQIPVSKYRSFKDPNDIKIVPFDRVSLFEAANPIIYHQTDNPEEEYYELRRKFYLEEIKNNNRRIRGI